MTDTTQALFTLDVDDARTVEELLIERGAIEARIALIFSRASQAKDPVRVVFGPAPSAEFIIGGVSVGSAYVVGAGGCGVYDVGDLECRPIDCDQVPQYMMPGPVQP